MLVNPIIEQLSGLKLHGMVKALEELMNSKGGQDLSFEERLGLMVDRESLERENRRLTTRLRKAKLKIVASVEDIDFRHPRGLEKQEILSMASCRWIREHLNVIITGPTGVGKTYLACALGHKACLTGHTTLYKRASNLFTEIGTAKGDGTYPRLMKALIKADLLIIDDFGLECLNKNQALDLLELLEERYDNKSTLVTAQVPVDQWHALIGDPTLADAALDRLVHNAYKINLKGESMRKKRAELTNNKSKMA